jgi:hypothetical protein
MQINHTWREGNRTADWLANFSIYVNHLNLIILETPPTKLQKFMFDDISGACKPRKSG